MASFDRRKLLAGLAASVSASLFALKGREARAAASPEKPKLKKYSNEHFYGADGAFDADVAKKAFYEMMEFYNYPIPARLRTDEFWTLDFNTGKFTEVGMAGIFWINRKEDNYFGHEIYLLPGQMIPEHKHVKTPDAGPKLEGWHVRHGWVRIYGEGEPTPGVEKRIPPMHRQCANARREQKIMPGEVGYLGGPEQWHSMVAGPEGAIVTEYATYHDGNGLRFSHPKVSL